MIDFRISPCGDPRTRADDETRTRDPNLGKVVRYQLRYIRMLPDLSGRLNDFSRRIDKRQTQGARACLGFDDSWEVAASGKIVTRPRRVTGDWRSW